MHIYIYIHIYSYKPAHILQRETDCLLIIGFLLSNILPPDLLPLGVLPPRLMLLGLLPPSFLPLGLLPLDLMLPGLSSPSGDGRPVAGRRVASRLVAGRLVASRRVAGRLVAGCRVASRRIAGCLDRGCMQIVANNYLVCLVMRVLFSFVIYREKYIHT